MSVRTGLGEVMLSEIDCSTKFCPECGFPDSFHRTDCVCVKEDADVVKERLSKTNNTSPTKNEGADTKPRPVSCKLNFSPLDISV